MNFQSLLQKLFLKLEVVVGHALSTKKKVEVLWIEMKLHQKSWTNNAFKQKFENLLPKQEPSIYKLTPISKTKHKL